MKRITLLFIAMLAIVGTMEAQFIPSGSAVNGARYSGVQNKPNPTTNIEQLLVRYNNLKNSYNSPKQDVFTPYERQLLSAYLNAQNTGNRGPQAVLLTEGFDDITTLPGAGYGFVNVSDAPGLTDWFQGNDAVFPAQSGASTSYIGANFNNTGGSVINNFMITPVLNLENGDEISETRFSIYDHSSKRVTIDTFSFLSDTFTFIEFRYGHFLSYEDIVKQFALDNPGQYDTIGIEQVENRTRE